MSQTPDPNNSTVSNPPLDLLQPWINLVDQRKALKLYGVEENEYSSDGEMFDLIHQMRSRIITSSAFNGDRVLGAILFEMTMDREVEGTPAADYYGTPMALCRFLRWIKVGRS